MKIKFILLDTILTVNYDFRSRPATKERSRLSRDCRLANRKIEQQAKDFNAEIRSNCKAIKKGIVRPGLSLRNREPSSKKDLPSANFHRYYLQIYY